MTEEDVIKALTANLWISDGRKDSPDATKDIYFPDDGVIMGYRAHSENGQKYLSVYIDQAGVPMDPDAEKMLQDAKFYVFGDGVASSVMLLSGGQARTNMIEVCRLSGENLVHKLQFSDGLQGEWICIPHH